MLPENRNFVIIKEEQVIYYKVNTKYKDRLFRLIFHEKKELLELYNAVNESNQPSLECTALVLNVNYGHNKDLMERCKTLKEYAQFVAEIRRNLSYGMKAQEAVEKCIQNDILAGILRKNRGEIVDSILTEWDEDDFIAGVKEDSKNEGIKIGEERGELKGKIENTIEMCQEFQLSKEDTLDRIIKKFSMKEEEAEKYMKEYWKCD